MELEDRVLFSATPMAMAVAPHGAASGPGHIHPLGPQESIHDASSAQVLPLGPQMAAWSRHVPSHLAGSTSSASQAESNVVLIDSQLVDSAQLIADVAPGAKVFVYNSQTDSAAQVLHRVVAWANATGNRIEDLAILSHGVGGAFELGNQWITATSLWATAPAWQKLSSVLAAGASVEIFGCNVAAPGSDGQSLLNALAAVTHAAVFASTDSTGAGGNWQLAASSTGASPAALGASSVPLNTSLLAGYDGTLGTIAIDNTSSAATASGGASSLTFSHTVNSGSDSILIVEVADSHGGASDPLVSVTYGSQSLNLLGSATLVNAESADIWYLLSPTVGTANVVVTLSGSCHFVASATDYFGVNQTTPLGTLATATGSTSTPSATVVSAPGQLVIDSLVAQGDVAPIAPTGPGQTELWSQTTGTSAGDALGGGSYQAGASSVTMSWTENSAHNWALAAVSLISAAPVTTLTVTTAADTVDGSTSSTNALVANPGPDGKISLREAIEAADNTASATPITIDFAIPGSGPQTINLTSALPTITSSVIIDGTSQPGYAGTPLIQLQGTSNPYNGLNISTNNVTIEGLSVYDFSAGNGIQITGASGTVIQADYIGLTANGTVGANGTGIVLTDATNSLIGGTTAAHRNVISGNTYGGMRLEAGSSDNVIEGNYIGLNAEGTATRANSLDGILITGAPNNTIGGTAAGAGNVISGNSGPGIEITGAGSTGNLVAGNYLGTNAAGTAALGNNGEGVEIDSGASSNTIGGTAAADRNIISGNAADGIFITGGDNNQIEGNYIGTNATGTAALANTDEGVEIAGGTGNVIGGAVVGAGNVISGNGQLGVWLYGNSSLNTNSNFVEGNLIGTDAAGMAALGNGFSGIEITDSNANTIGGTTAVAGNFISGNAECGIMLQSSSSNNLVEGNFIGTAADGVTALGNATGGVWIDSSSGNTIGSTTPGAGNIIANTTAGNGVTVVGSSTQDAIEGNSIYGDSGLGIDLNDDGLTANGPVSPRVGPNNLQNYPVLSGAIANGTNFTVSGTLNSAALGNYEIDFYWSPVGSPLGYGEGKTYIGSTSVTTDALGNASFNTTVTGVSVPTGAVISATATDSSGSTSEFAQDLNVTYVNQPPTVAKAASATPNPVTGTSTALSVLGADDGGEANLTYTWAATGSPPAPVTFSDNGTNGAKDVTAAFAAPGNYSFQVTITDAGGLSTTSSVSVSVIATLSSIVIQPGPAAMADNTTYPFSATGLDQFGNPLASQPVFTWSVDGGGAGGTINTAGLYATPASNTGADTIRATSGSISGTASVTVTGDGIFSGGYNVGPTNLPGSFSYNAGTYTLTGGYLNPTTDGFQFADATFTGNTMLVAQVTNLNGTTTPAAGGVVFRDSTGDLSAYAGVVLGPGNQATFYYRTSTGGSSQATTVSNVQAQWVEIVRNGNTFRGYYSANDVTWTQVGSSVTYADPSTILGGLVVSSLNASTLSTATFANIASTVPAIATPAAASPNPVTGTSTIVSVLGAYAGGESNLTYTWSSTGAPPAPVIFADNGDNSAKDTTVSFTKAGVYNLLVTASDGVQSVTSSVNVTVVQTLTGITVSPVAAALNENATRQFTATAYDQFGNALAAQPSFTWALASGVGSVSASGLYTAPGNSGSASIRATSGLVSGSAPVTVAPVNPTLAVTVPGPQNSQPIGIVLSAANGNAVTISDVTAGNTAIQVALTATNGAITLAGTQGLTFSLGSGQQNAQIVMAGTLAQLNAAMNGMLFRPTAQSAELQVVASAQGNSGTGSGAVVITQVLTPPPPSPPIVNPNLPGPQPIVPVQSVAPPILAVVLAVSPVPPARPPQTLIQPTSRPQRVPAATISFSALQQQNVAQAWSVESTICQPGVVKPHGRVLAGPVNPPAVKAELSCVEAGSPLWDDLNAMDKKLGAPLTRQEVAVGTALTVSAAFTAGYVIWMLRGGMLLTSLLAQMPAWRLVDPLVVLSRTSDLDDGEQETLETIVDSLEDRPIEPAAQAETIA